MRKPQEFSKFFLYEKSVQCPNWQVDYLPQFCKWLTGREPRSFREDFCGSGKIACEWVLRNKKNRALGIDIDEEALRYANEVNRRSLPPEAQKRVRFLDQNVLKPTREKFDWIGAFNFSYFVFHTRKELLKYFKAAHASLEKKGTLFLEVAGGEGFLEPGVEEHRIKIPKLGDVKQIWESHQYDPITQVNDYSIHFQLPSGEWMNDAFRYHWRIWGIRDLREILLDAGFRHTVVLWEKTDRDGKGIGQYEVLEESDRPDSWVAYVVGVKG